MCPRYQKRLGSSKKIIKHKGLYQWSLQKVVELKNINTNKGPTTHKLCTNFTRKMELTTDRQTGKDAAQDHYAQNAYLNPESSLHNPNYMSVNMEETSE